MHRDAARPDAGAGGQLYPQPRHDLALPVHHACRSRRAGRCLSKARRRAPGLTRCAASVRDRACGDRAGVVARSAPRSSRSSRARSARSIARTRALPTCFTIVPDDADAARAWEAAGRTADRRISSAQRRQARRLCRSAMPAKPPSRAVSSCSPRAARWHFTARRRAITSASWASPAPRPPEAMLRKRSAAWRRGRADLLRPASSRDLLDETGPRNDRGRAPVRVRAAWSRPPPMASANSCSRWA